MGVAAQWFYRKEGMLDDSTIGPISDDEIAELIRTRKLRPSTLVASPTATAGQWVQLSTIDLSAALGRYDAKIQKQRQLDEQARAAIEAAQHAEREQKEREDRELRELQIVTHQQQLDQQRQARAAYLASIRDHQRRYRVIAVDVQEADHLCNRMGAEGWQLDAAFAETFSYQQCGGCCQPDTRRQFVFVFSQPLNMNQ